MATNRVDFGFTQREGYEYIRKLIEDSGNATLTVGDKEIDTDTFIQWLDHKVELLDSKKSGERKPTAKQIANEGYKENILAFMEPNHMYSAAEIAKGCPETVEDGVTVGTVVALLTQLYKAERINRITEKGKNYYTLPAEGEGE